MAVRRGRAPPLPLPAATAAKASESEWIPLPQHSVFQSKRAGAAPRASSSPLASGAQGKRFGVGGGKNLVAWDASSSRLYLWDAEDGFVHRISVRFGDPDDEGCPSVEAASPSEILLTDIHINFSVNHISLNGEGSALLVAGSGGLYVIYVYDRVSSNDDSIVCRTVSVGSELYFGQSSGLRIIQVSWHPCSRTHIGILSSDSVFRLYDLSSDLKQPEQEYYLQPIQPGRCDNMMSKCPVAFCFGGEHLWDRFSVFILFSDGSVYILCPIVPFGSIFGWQCIEEIYEDANVFGLKSSTAKAVSNSMFAISWIEATFPEIANKSATWDNLAGLRAHPYAPIDSSLLLQGPLCKVSHGMATESFNFSSEYNGKALGFLYNSIGKDSILVIAWSSGQLQIDALADEVQPLWSASSSVRLRVDSRGRLLGIAMICESNSQEKLNLPINQGIAETVWLGNPPPLLRLAIVDLALPKIALNNTSFSLFGDPIVSERIYCLHNGGIDLITLHFLPFSSTDSGSIESAKAPSVHPILGACDSETRSLLCGFTAIADSFGNSRVVAVTPSYECFLLEMKQWNGLPPLPVDLNIKSVNSADTNIPGLINKDMLAGPKMVLVPEVSALRSLSAESIEGRSALHHYIKLFHEHYVEYAHKVYFELKQHANHVKAILDQQHTRLHDVNQMLSCFEAKQPALKDRVNRAIQRYMCLDKRLQNLNTLPGARRKPLSLAEREFKAQLENLAGPESDAWRSSIETLKARLRRHTQSTSNTMGTSRHIPGKSNQVLDAHISQLKSSMSKLSLLNNENTKKVKIIEDALKDQEDVE